MVFNDSCASETESSWGQDNLYPKNYTKCLVYRTMLPRQVNDKDEVGKVIEVKRDNVWAKAEIVEIVDDTSQQD